MNRNRYLLFTVGLLAIVIIIVIVWGEYLRKQHRRASSDVSRQPAMSLFESLGIREDTSEQQRVLFASIVADASVDCGIVDQLLRLADRAHDYTLLSSLIESGLRGKNPTEQICLLLLKSEVAAKQGHYEEAEQIMEQLIGALPENLDVLQKAADLSYRQRHFDRAEVLGLKVAHLAAQKSDQWREGRALGNLAAVFATRGRVEKAIELQDIALEIHRRLDSAEDIMKDHYNRASMRLMLKDEEGALADYREALARAEELDRKEMIITVLNQMVIILRQQGRTNDSDFLWQRCLGIIEENKNPTAVFDASGAQRLEEDRDSPTLVPTHGGGP